MESNTTDEERIQDMCQPILVDIRSVCG